MTRPVLPVSPKRQRGMCFPRWRVGLTSAVWLCVAATVSAADPPARAVLHLVNESHVSGEVRGSDDPKVMRWRSPAFAEPLDFPLAAVRAVHYEALAPPPAPRDEYGF